MIQCDSCNKWVDDSNVCCGCTNPNIVLCLECCRCGMKELMELMELTELNKVLTIKNRRKMKATQITYSRLFNKGNYEHERVEITLEIEAGEKAADVLEKAKIFVDNSCPDKDKKNEYERAVQKVKNPDNFTVKQLREAQEIIDDYNLPLRDDLPF